jgi:hypothetical protein
MATPGRLHQQAFDGMACVEGLKDIRPEGEAQ